MKRKTFAKGFAEIIALLLSLLVLIPFYLIVVNSFKTKQEAAGVGLGLPGEWQIAQNYGEMFRQSNIGMAFRNSLLLTLPSVLAVILVCAMAAFVLQRSRGRGNSMLTSLVLLGLFIPGQIIPTYFICNFLGLRSFLAAALVLIAANIPMGVFLYMGYYKSIPREIDESAMIDGCGTLRLFFSIILPLLKPMTVTLFIITFMAFWNDFGTTIYFLNSPSNFTLTLTVYNFFSAYSSDWNLIFANVVMVSLPVVLVYFFAQRQIMSGMTAGAVKG